MALLNLPRKVRFLRKNIIIIGIIPALRKEPNTLNPFLKPLVKELNVLYNGIHLNTYRHPGGISVRAALMCVSADIPAQRKLCGFLSHSASLGCSKCYKVFSGRVSEQRNYGGFNTAQWKPRTVSDHRKCVNKILKAQTKTAAEKLESECGYRYTVLLDLPYFDTIKFHVIDPMHNLFESTARNVFKMWVETELLKKKDACNNRRENQKYQSWDRRSSPTNRHIIQLWSSSFTAEQWKIWTLEYSMYVLKGLIPESHYICWQIFVQACRKICSPVISQDDVTAHLLFLKYCNTFEDIYSSEAIRPNMHMHCHLQDSVQNFGPVYSFWLFFIRTVQRLAWKNKDEPQIN